VALIVSIPTPPLSPAAVPVIVPVALPAVIVPVALPAVIVPVALPAVIVPVVAAAVTALLLPGGAPTITGLRAVADIERHRDVA
jgi:hypothetical protein